MTFGIISDTHGILDTRLVDILKECNHIIHAGDIGEMHILTKLKSLTIPVSAVYGNCDPFTIRKNLQASLQLDILENRIEINHFPFQENDLPVNPEQRWHIYISGHTHRPAVAWKPWKLYLNPGSASKPRQGPQKTAMKLTICKECKPQIEIIEI